VFALNSPESAVDFDASLTGGHRMVARVVSPPGSLGDKHLDQWVHVAVEFNCGVVQLAVDGKIVSKEKLRTRKASDGTAKKHKKSPKKAESGQKSRKSTRGFISQHLERL